MSHRKFPSKFPLVALAGLIVVGGIGAVLVTTGTIHLLDQKKAPNSSSVESHNRTNSLGPASPTKVSSAPSSEATTPSSLTPGNYTSSTVSLSAPSGAFVSFHDPNLSGSPAPNQLQSSCSSTPGATCTIKFTSSNGVTKSLPSQLIGSSGATTWAWQLQELGLTQGTWHLTAKVGLLMIPLG